MQYIDVSNNALAGFLPPSWGQMRPLRVLDLRSNCGICGGFPPLQNNVTIYFSGTNLDTTCNAFNCAVPFFGNLLLAVGVVMAALLLCMVQQQVSGSGRCSLAASSASAVDALLGLASRHSVLAVLCQPITSDASDLFS